MKFLAACVLLGLALCACDSRDGSGANKAEVAAAKAAQEAERKQEDERAERVQVTEDCKTNAKAKDAEYRKLMAAKEYWPATLVIRQCAELLNNPKLKALVADGEVKSYIRDIESRGTKDWNTLRAMDSFARDYPDRAKKHAKAHQELKTRLDMEAAKHDAEVAAMRNAPPPDRRPDACVKAIMSSMGTSTRNYSDKMAYDAHVRENCKGYNLP